MLVRSAHPYFIIAVIAGCITSSAFADSANVTAVLSNSEATVGETVQLQMKITGARGAEAPRDIAVDGLEIHRTGTEQRVEMNNFNMSSSVIYNYTILPLRPGNFRIPPQAVKVGGTSLRTPELTLHVADAPGGTTSRRRSAPPNVRSMDARRYGFLYLVVPKREAYVGEMVPVEIKLGLNAQTQFTAVDFPDLNVQGVTLQRAQKPDENRETRDGVTYHLSIFKGALSAVRPGKIELPSLETTAVAMIRQPFPDIRDPFDERIFRDPFDLIEGKPRKLSFKSDPVPLEIKPLPPNAPSSFSGAVGTFTMDVDIKPKTVQVGDPITVTATISGRGNFGVMSAPNLEDTHGWHTYPSSNKFAQNDDVGISGTKTFEMVISPNEKKTAVPPLAFSYFDPLKEKYVTLQSAAIPIQVEGGAVAATQSSPQATPAQTASAPAGRNPQEILYQLTDRGRIQSFAPIYTQPVFWLAQTAPLSALLLLIGWRIHQRKSGNREAKRIATLEQEAAGLMRQLRKKDLPPQEYFGQAAQAIRVKTALAKNVDPNTVDAESAANAFELDGESREQLKRLFDRSDELRYSGSGNGLETVSTEARREVLELLESL